ncbi:AIG2-like family [Novymonas esmeraldas]|uniref:gamma-glutamylcyclotransferase n=1 Tax=Novymonas esmeraldas TaxID=1808958 RepID=A0AAW0F9G9_9TRYP
MAASDKAGTFYYFAYGTYVDAEELTRALAPALGSGGGGGGGDGGGGGASMIRSAHPALLPGYRLVCNAVSAEGPRLGRLNVTPLSLVARDPSATRQRTGKSKSGKTHEFTAAFRDGVRGVLYELPTSVRESLLLAVAREGSFNMYAMLTCYEMSDVRRGVRAPDSPIHESLVVAALDMPLMERQYFIEAPMKLRWQTLPRPQGVAAQPGLAAGVVSSSSSSSAAGGGGGDAAGPPRWPGVHWCNCTVSARVAPSPVYAALLAAAYRERLHVDMAAATASTTRSTSRSSASSEGGGGGDTESYATTMHNMVSKVARDTSKDAQEARTWYLAYGSNLSWEQVCIRIGPPYQRRAAKLPDFVLVPNAISMAHQNREGFGYYNVEPAAVRERKVADGLVQHRSTMPSYVCGAAYEISQAQLEMMDTYERGYTRELRRCTDLRDATAPPLECWTYTALHTSEEALPSREYLARVLEGGDILPLEYMEGIRATATNPLRSPRQDKRLNKEL